MNTKSVLTDLLKFLLFLGIGLSILFYLYYRQEKAYQEYCTIEGIAAEACDFLGKIISDFKSVNYYWIGLVLLCYVISNVSRTARWFQLIKPLGHQPRWINGFGSIMIGYFANLGIPRIGEVIRAGTFSRYEKMPVDKVMGTVVVDRIVDAVTLLSVIGLAFLLSFQDIWGAIQAAQQANANAEEASTFPFLFWIGLGGLALVLFVGFIFRQQILASALFKKVWDFALGLKEGILSIRHLERPWLFLFHSVTIWLMYYLMTYIAFFAFAPTAELSPIAGLLIFVFGALGIVVPSPGGMGAYQGLVMIPLIYIYSMQEADAFSFANILFFSIQIGANVLLGLIALLVLPLVNRN